jgi:hypothetical protein
MSYNNIRRSIESASDEYDEIDAIVHIRSRLRCQFERSGMDPVSIAVHLLAETGELPGWDIGFDDGGEGWAA